MATTIAYKERTRRLAHTARRVASASSAAASTLDQQERATLAHSFARDAESASELCARLSNSDATRNDAQRHYSNARDALRAVRGYARAAGLQAA